MTYHTERPGVLFFRSGTDSSYDDAALKIGYVPYTISPITKSFLNIPELTNMLLGQSYDGIIFTSQTAVEAVEIAVTDCALPESTLHLPVFVVGKATAKRAKEFGFISVVGEASGSANKLYDIILEYFSQFGVERESMKLLFPGAAKLIGDLGPRLNSIGLKVDILPVYSTSSRNNDCPGFRRELEAIEALKTVVFFSPSGVKSVLDLIINKWPKVRFIAIGPTTAKSLSSCYIAESPTVEGVMDCLEKLRQNTTF